MRAAASTRTESNPWPQARVDHQLRVAQRAHLAAQQVDLREGVAVA